MTSLFVEFVALSRMIKVQQASHEIFSIDPIAMEDHDYGLNTKQCVHANPLHFQNLALPITVDVHV